MREGKGIGWPGLSLIGRAVLAPYTPYHVVYESIILKGLVIGYMMKLRYTLLTRPISDRPGCYVLSTYILYLSLT